MRFPLPACVLLVLVACQQGQVVQTDTQVPPPVVATLEPAFEAPPPVIDTTATQSPATSTPTGAPVMSPPPVVSPTTPSFDTATVRRIPLFDAKQAVDSGRAIMVDVRPAGAFQNSRVSGALNIPEAEIAARADELPRDKMIITYCT